MAWRIERWGGSWKDERHVAFTGTEKGARNAFDLICMLSTSGTVDLLDDEGLVVLRLRVRATRLQPWSKDES